MTVPELIHFYQTRGAPDRTSLDHVAGRAREIESEYQGMVIALEAAGFPNDEVTTRENPVSQRRQEFLAQYNADPDSLLDLSRPTAAIMRAREERSADEKYHSMEVQAELPDPDENGILWA